MQTARDKIRELRALHEDGLLSQQEFDSRKNAILDAEYAPPGGSGAPIQINQGTELGLMAGMEIGPHTRRYRLERLIASGGMGQVWQASDLATHAEIGHSEQVAIKILPPHLTQGATRAKLLVEEATQARRLAHEHIVRVYEWAQDPATSSYFIIMECLEGEDLEHLLAREGKLPLARVDALLQPVAQALDYAWEKARLVHRDIKPGNVFVTRKGEVKLLDFGIAARARSNASTLGTEAPGDSGTAGYRAPEAGTHQRQPGQRLDVYAVSVMVYQMVEGHMPFDGPRTAHHEPPKPDSLSEPEWEALKRGFSWQADERPVSVGALLESLRTGGEKKPTPVARNEEATARRRAELLARATADAHRKAALARQKIEEEEARKARKEDLRRQLAERRALELAKLRQEQEETQRKAMQAKAAAAYLAEQQRARAELAVRNAAALAAQMPSAASPTADPAGVLRDRFNDGSGLGPELVLVPTGRFQMGSNDHERKKAIAAGSQQAWLERETPQRWVGIEQSFALGRFPVTVGEWRQFVQATGWQQQGEIDWSSPGFSQDESHPVVGVSWHDAQQYCAWLSQRTGQRYRLPSEAEWEYACRAGSKTAFSFGDTISTDQANYDGNQSYNNSPKGSWRKGTSPVGAYAPNPWGLYDMHGNVWEWVQDPVHENYQGAPLTGRPWEEGGDDTRRILRGGSWQYSPRYLRSAIRNGYSANLSNDIVGFRVVRDL
jgi:formylglycine-generating enzyme required for sulfatase activity